MESRENERKYEVDMKQLGRMKAEYEEESVSGT